MYVNMSPHIKNFFYNPPINYIGERGGYFILKPPINFEQLGLSPTKPLLLRTMKVLIIRTDIDEKALSRSLTGIDSAITLELYQNYRVNKRVGGNWDDSLNRLTANHCYSKYTFIDEKIGYIGTFDSMDKVLKRNPFLGNTLILTHEQWLDKQCPKWKENPRYKYY